MRHFPDPAFAWTFVVLLLAMLIAAAIIDIRTTKIPKKLTMTIWGAGILINIVRGAWLGSMGIETWELGPGTAWLGALDGLLFSLMGLTIAFVLFFGMWMLGSCGGGDVKLCAGIGAWIGAVYTIFLLFATVGALILWIVARLLTGGMPSLQKMHKAARQNARSDKKTPAALPRSRMTFSAPAALATAVVMLWVYRFDLGLLPRPEPPQPEANNASMWERNANG